MIIKEKKILVASKIRFHLTKEQPIKKEIRARVCVCVLERKSKYRNIVLSPHDDDDDNFTLAVHSSEQVLAVLSTHSLWFPHLESDNDTHLVEFNDDVSNRKWMNWGSKMDQQQLFKKKVHDAPMMMMVDGNGMWEKVPSSFSFTLNLI